MYTAKYISDEIDLTGKISTESQAPTNPFLDQLLKIWKMMKCKALISTSGNYCFATYGSKTVLGINSKIGCRNIQCQEIVTKFLFQHAMKRSGMVRIYSILT